MILIQNPKILEYLDYIICKNKNVDTLILENILNEITKELPNAICIGSSTDGEINNDKITTLNTIITISTFDKTALKIAYVNEKNSFTNGTKLATLLCNEDTKLLITFTDGAKTNGEEFLNGISSINNKIIISGGMAGDNAHFTQTFISCQNKILLLH